MRNRSYLYPTLLVVLLLVLTACAGESDAVPEISEAEISAAEITAEVPELDAVHELMYPLWHGAFPEQDYDSIRQLVPQFEPMLAAVEAVELPGILRHKQEGWDTGKTVMMSSFEGLKRAVEANDNAAILSHTEAFHMGYEQLVRVIRPLVPELEAFHQELYKIVHYYKPAADQEKMHEAALAMIEKMEPLRAAELPERLADRKADFDAGVAALGERLSELDEALHASDGEAINAAVDAVHAAYGVVEGVFQ
ncbi:hypothetical protein ACFL3B_06185 [Gemmatimonadota bacterium]